MEKNDRKDAALDREEAPTESRPDWEALRPAELDPAAPAKADEERPVNGGIEKTGEHPEEDDDNAFEDSDEALPDDREERALARHPGREGSRFDEI
jgi:hypothetical protein